MAYRFGAKQKTLSIGVYPKVSLKEARRKRDIVHKLLEKNINRSQHKRKERRKAVVESLADTFEGVARELISKNKNKWSATMLEALRAD